ncbi:hypothetical protein CHUAL_004565 [Chamberlinius hualienensis]
MSRFLGPVCRLSTVRLHQVFFPSTCKLHNETAESTEVKRRRLQYQSRKRGMLENCILLSTFSSKYLSTFNNEQLDLYDRLLNDPSNDWDIYYWATGLKETPSEFKNELMDLFTDHVKNYEKQPRSLHPKLLSEL